MTGIRSCVLAVLAVLTGVGAAGGPFNAVARGATGTTGSVAGTTAKGVALAVTNSIVTVSKAGSGTGTVTSDVGAINCGGTCSDTYADGTPITLTATAPVGSQFTGWLGPCTGTGTCQFTLNGPTTVSATFAATAIGRPRLDLDATGSCDALTDGLLVLRYLSGLSGAALINAAVGQGAVRTTDTQIGNYLLDVRPVLDVDGNGQADASSDGLLITRYLFGLRGDGLIAGAVGSGATRPDASGIEAQIQSLCLPPTPIYMLSVSKTGSGAGTMTSSPAGINCGTACAADYDGNTIVALTPVPAIGSSFTGWSGACTGTGTCNLTMNAAKFVSANFALNTYYLTVAKSGAGAGLVTSSPAGINCGTSCSASYDYGTVVTLTAAASIGSTFTGWSGSGCAGTGTCNVTMDAAKSVSANFTLNTYLLTVAKGGTGAGLVTSSPAGINCGISCSASYDYGTGVTLTAAASIGSTFTGWSGSGCAGTGTCNVTMDAAKSVSANFALNTYYLTVAKSGAGAGLVTSSPAGINCGTSCSASYDYGTVVTLTAAASIGSTFTGWSGACTGVGTCNVTMNAAKVVIAVFDGV